MRYYLLAWALGMVCFSVNSVKADEKEVKISVKGDEVSISIPKEQKPEGRKSGQNGIFGDSLPVKQNLFGGPLLPQDNLFESPRSSEGGLLKKESSAENAKGSVSISSPSLFNAKPQGSGLLTFGKLSENNTQDPSAVNQLMKTMPGSGTENKNAIKTEKISVTAEKKDTVAISNPAVASSSITQLKDSKLEAPNDQGLFIYKFENGEGKVEFHKVLNNGKLNENNQKEYQKTSSGEHKDKEKLSTVSEISIKDGFLETKSTDEKQLPQYFKILLDKDGNCENGQILKPITADEREKEKTNLGSTASDPWAKVEEKKKADLG